MDGHRKIPPTDLDRTECDRCLSQREFADGVILRRKRPKGGVLIYGGSCALTSLRPF
jgi:hypothetical protein